MVLAHVTGFKKSLSSHKLMILHLEHTFSKLQIQIWCINEANV